MFYTMIIVFVIGYACIALEHPLQINKSATALILGAVMWVLLSMGDPSTMPIFSDFQQYLQTNPNGNFASWLSHAPLLEHLGEISEILFFLIGAMTIVELIDSYDGFSIITNNINTTKKTSLLWIIALLSFFMSAILDNLTTSIVMVALLRKLILDKEDRWFYAGMVIVAANAGGAWSPIGDVTTIMLWIAGKVSAQNIIVMTFLSSLVSLLVPLLILSLTMKGNVRRPEGIKGGKEVCLSKSESKFILFLGVGTLLFVPVFKSITHLPPYLGMLLGLGFMWLVTEILNRKRDEEDQIDLGVSNILKKIDMPSMLFFLGILMAVAAMQTGGQLFALSQSLETIPLEEPNKYYVITSIIGVLSSIVDNVPLVAGAMGMYDFPMDHYFWEFLAYAAGTGGSILIIGSAAGVAVMGMEKIDFIWYLKKISLLAFIGYAAGCGTYIFQKMIHDMLL
ncbi:sodium:proton antiporter [Bacteroidales bacterium]|nr:sodium:proton antiporter [Bacteroidales bacterium]